MFNELKIKFGNVITYLATILPTVASNRDQIKFGSHTYKKLSFFACPFTIVPWDCIVSIHREKVSKHLGRLQNNCQLDPLEFYAVQ